MHEHVSGFNNHILNFLISHNSSALTDVLDILSMAVLDILSMASKCASWHLKMALDNRARQDLHWHHKEI